MKMVNEHDIKDYMSAGYKQPANNVQHGGDHYKKYGEFQPWDAVLQWNLGYLEGTALKYIARWKDKNGIEDIKKAIHFLEKLVEVEQQKQQKQKPIQADWISVLNVQQQR